MLLPILGLLTHLRVVETRDAAPLAYRFVLNAPLKYRLTAAIKGKLPILESPEPIAANATIKLLYAATPKAVLDSGQADVDLVVEDAEAELEKIPLPIGPEQVAEFMNQTITLAATGQVVKTSNNADLPFSLSIPGVDPKRLYALLFPIVFPEKPVSAGEKWSFKSELIGEGAAKPTFTATLLTAQTGAVDLTPIRQEFTLPIKQSLDAKRKATNDKAKTRFVRTGKISGSGVFHFDAAKGQFVSGEMNLRADITEALQGKPAKGESAQKPIFVDAKITVKLEPPGAPAHNP